MSCFLSAVKNSSFSVCLGPLFTLMDCSTFYFIRPQDAHEIAHLSQLPNLPLLLIPSLRRTRSSSTPVHIFTLHNLFPDHYNSALSNHLVMISSYFKIYAPHWLTARSRSIVQDRVGAPLPPALTPQHSRTESCSTFYAKIRKCSPGVLEISFILLMLK